MAKFNIFNFREDINIRLYKHKKLLFKIIKALIVPVYILLFLTAIYQFGFKTSPEEKLILDQIMLIGIFVNIFYFILVLIYEFHPLSFIKEHLFEYIIIIFITIDQFVYIFTDNLILKHIINATAGKEIDGFYYLIQSIYLLLFVLFIFRDSNSLLKRIKIGPYGFLVFSFIFIIGLGTILLLMPDVSTTKVSFIDALFISTSASCVTGLATIDISTVFNLKGQFVILSLMKAGGLNIIMFVTFFSVMFKQSAGIKTNALIQQMIYSDKISGTRSLMQIILIYSIAFELIGATLLYITMPNEFVFNNYIDKTFFALFHSVAAFNNAGLSLLTDGLYDINFQFATGFQLTICALIISGGIGFVVFQDVVQKIKYFFKSNGQRKKLSLHSYIVIKTTIILLISGFVVILLLENNNSLAYLSIKDKIMAAFFQSVTTRSAGFNTMNFSILSSTTLFFIIFLMFIGSSPTSTGGGIKTTTFYVLIRAIWSNITGRNNVEVKKSTIDFGTIDRAYTILLFAITLICISTFLLMIAEPDIPFLTLLFEEVSAFGNVGLSVGITTEIGDFSKYILIFTMYAGRIGIPTLALALVKRVKYKDYKYPYKKIIVG